MATIGFICVLVVEGHIERVVLTVRLVPVLPRMMAEASRAAFKTIRVPLLEWGGARRAQCTVTVRMHRIFELAPRKAARRR